MSISLISQPETWGRVYDTNRLVYKFSSTNYTQPNFRFLVELKYYTLPSGTEKFIGSWPLTPDSGGTCEFNPSSVYKSYISYDLNLSKTALEECWNSALKFKLYVYEFYGTPPSKKTAGSWSDTTPKKLYNGCQQFVPFDYAALNVPYANRQWVMYSGLTTTAGQGKYLTDVTEYYMDNDDFGFLHFLSSGIKDGDDEICRPDKIRYKITYRTDIPSGKGLIFDGQTYLDMMGIGGGDYGNFGQFNDAQATAMRSTVSMEDPYTTGITQAGGTYTINAPSPPPPTSAPYITHIEYITGVTFTSASSLMAYFPMGPYQLINYTNIFTSYKNNWIYYDIDLMSGNNVINANPFRVFRKNKCGKYDKKQLFWLNSHGGWDTYTFTQKSSLEYKVSRNTYKQRLQPTFSPYDAGERVFDIQYQTEYTLRTDLLTQREAQMLMGILTTTRIYMLVLYQFNKTFYPYSVPMICTNDSGVVPNKKNDKEVFFEVKVRPSNEKVTQKD